MLARSVSQGSRGLQGVVSVVSVVATADSLQVVTDQCNSKDLKSIQTAAQAR